MLFGARGLAYSCTRDMGKPRKSRKNRFNYDKNRRRAWKRSKKLPAIPCDPIKKAWDETKSAAQNLKDMGLSADPNKTLGIPSIKRMLDEYEQRVEQQFAQMVDSSLASTSEDSKLKRESKASKAYVAEALEVEASQTYASTMQLSNPIVQFCVYMMNKHGDDYKAMARDPKNHYQETPKQIRRKINTFKNTPSQYREYMASLQGEGKGGKT